jgi:hypothetical protein
MFPCRVLFWGKNINNCRAKQEIRQKSLNAVTDFSRKSLNALTDFHNGAQGGFF